jgi:hypothetical protein
MKRLMTIALVLAGLALVSGCRGEEEVPPEHFYSEDIDGVGVVQTYDIEPDYRLVLDEDTRRAQDLADQAPESPAEPGPDETPAGPGEGENEGDTAPAEPGEDQGQAPAGPGDDEGDPAPPAPDF